MSFLSSLLTYGILAQFATTGVVTADSNLWSIDETSFELLSSLDQNELTIGDTIEFRFTLQASEVIEGDTLIVEMSPSYNGFSSLLFCGKPTVLVSDNSLTYNIYGSTYDSTFEGISFDSYIFDFGEVNATAGTSVTFELQMLVADNQGYVVGDDYWMGVGVEFNQSQNLWINDIAFVLAPKPGAGGQMDMYFDLESQIYTYVKGASQSNFLTLINPYLSLGFRQTFTLKDNSEHICICDVRPFDMDRAFIGCQNPSFPPWVTQFHPPFNDTVCKKKFEVDFGVLTKLNIPFADALDEVTLEIIICTSDFAVGEYELDVLMDVSGGTVGENIETTLNFVSSPKASLTTFQCQLDLVHMGNGSKGQDLSVRAIVKPSPFDTSATYVIRHTMTVQGCENPTPIVDIEPRLVDKSRHIEFLNSIQFWNDSGTLYAEYNKVLVTRKHHTLYTDQEHFELTVDFRGTFDTSLLDCPNMEVFSEVIMVRNGNQEFSQCRETLRVADAAFYDSTCDDGPAIEVMELVDKVNPSMSMYAGNQASVSFALTFDQRCTGTILRNFVLDAKLIQEGANFPSLLSLGKFRLAHVGDNFPGLQRRAKKADYEHKIFSTSTTYNVSVSQVSLRFGDVDYLAITDDIFDRRIVFTAEFSLLNEESLTSLWTHDIAFSASRDPSGENFWEQTVELLVFYDVNTSSLVYPDFHENYAMFVNGSHDLLRLDHLFPYPTAMEPLSDVWYHLGQVLAWRSALYISSYPAYNRMLLALYIPAAPSYLSYDSISINPGRNLYLQALEDFSEVTHNTYTLEDLKFVWAVANLESYGNETKSDDVLEVVVHVRVTGEDEEVEEVEVYPPPQIAFCYIDYYTLQSKYCAASIKDIPGMQPDLMTSFNQLPPVISQESAEVRIPKSGAGIFPFQVYIPPRSSHNTAVRIKAGVVASSGAYPCVAIAEGLQLTTAHKYIGYLDYEAFTSNLSSCLNPEDFEDVDGIQVCNEIYAEFGIVSNMNVDVTAAVELTENKIDFTAVIGVNEYCEVGSQIWLHVSVYDNSDQTLLAEETFDNIFVSEISASKKQEMFAKVHNYDNGSISNDRLTATSGVVKRFLLEVYLGDFLTDHLKVTVESKIFSDTPSDLEDGGAAFTVVGLHLWEIGTDIYGAFDLKNTMEIQLHSFLYDDTGPIMGFQENGATLDLGTVSHIPIDRDAERSVDQSERQARSNGILLAVDIELQDERFILRDVTKVQLFFAVEAKLHQIVYSAFITFHPEFLPDRKPIVWMNITSYFLVTRDALPGDQGVYMVELFHDCGSRSEAVELNLVIHLPNYARYIAADWINNVGRAAKNETLNPNSIQFLFPNMHKTEYLKFNVTIQFSEDDPYFTEARIYFTALPMEHFYLQFSRDTDLQPNGTIYSPKISTEIIQLVVQESYCSEKLDVHDLSRNNPCQFSASSYLDPIVNPATESFLFSDKVYRSNNWGGQYSTAQNFKVALVDDFYLARLYVNMNTTVKKFRIKYSTDIEGKYWRQYEELQVWREFSLPEAFPSTEPKHIHELHKVGYFNIRVLTRLKWIQFIFTELSLANVGVTWRFELSGCTPTDSVSGDYIRSCGLERREPVRPEFYKRGFLADPDARALFVCDWNLKTEEMDCFRMTLANGKQIWTVLTKKIAGVIGYLLQPEFQLFAIGRSQLTYMSSSDAGNTWWTCQTKDWWGARAQSVQKFKSVLMMPSQLPLAQVDSLTVNWAALEDSWYGEETFRANNSGIYLREDPSVNQWIRVYNWGSECC